MALVILSAEATTNTELRTVSARRLVFGVVAIALITLAAGFAIGFELARESAPPVEVAPQAEPSGEPESRFLIGRVGELSGRLMRLESEAILLAKRIGLKRDAHPAQPAEKTPAKPAAVEAEGGPMIPAIGAAAGSESASQMEALNDSLRVLEQDLARLESQLTTIDEMAAQKSVLSMVFPSRVPVEGGKIGSDFGNRRDPFNNRLAFHSGLDFPAEKGTPIRASAGGLVIYAAFRGDYGRQVEIDHGNGLVTRYSHAARLRVKVGDVVTPGQHIADVGSSGRSTGPHLHFEVLKNGRYVDPEDFLRLG